MNLRIHTIIRTFITALWIIVFCDQVLAADFSLESPDKQLMVKINVGSQLTYSVSFQDKPVILESELILKFENAGTFGPNMTVQDTESKSVDETWEPVWGINTPVRDRYNQLCLKLSEQGDSSKRMELVFRAFDDAVAFRYILPEQSAMQSFTLSEENTAFVFPDDPVCWAADYERFVSHQEALFNKSKLSELSGRGLYGLPLLAYLPESKVYVAITEANLTDWAGMYLKPADHKSVLTSVLSPIPGSSELVKAKTPHASPWRVIMIAREPGKLIESDVIVNLNEPCAIVDTSWIKPGKMAWDHWWSGDVKMDTETNKQYIKFASQMGFDYQLVDWQWYGPFNDPNADVTTINPAVDMPELLRFAKENDVKLWLWLYWSDIDRQMDQAFALYEKWGIAGVKIDFMQRDDQPMVNWYHNTVKLAAKHHLMVNFHGAYKPTGFRRTYPNLMTREGVLGNEYNKWSRNVTPTHNVTIPFTRMLAGPMDYTPGGFINRTPEQFEPKIPTEVMTTRCQQLAMFVVYETPLICVCDHPDNYNDQPGLAFLKMVPTTWDQTKVLDAKVGEYITVARKHGQDWFVGAMTNEQPRELKIALDFLGEGSFTAHIFKDAPDANVNPERLVEYTQDMTAEESLTMKLASGGGLAIKFSPKK